MQINSYLYFAPLLSDPLTRQFCLNARCQLSRSSATKMFGVSSCRPHSYHYRTDNIDNIIATTNYITKFTAAINKENIYATQFHPEKSHHFGIKLLKNFSEI